MQPTILLFVLILAAFADAVRVFRNGNGSKAVGGTAPRPQDFGPLNDNGNYFKDPHGLLGLSVFIDRSFLPHQKHVWSIDIDQIVDAGFLFIIDGSDTPLGRNVPGHRGIGILAEFKPLDLLNALNALPWVKEPAIIPTSTTSSPTAVAATPPPVVARALGPDAAQPAVSGDARSSIQDLAAAFPKRAPIAKTSPKVAAKARKSYFRVVRG